MSLFSCAHSLGDACLNLAVHSEACFILQAAASGPALSGGPEDSAAAFGHDENADDVHDGNAEAALQAAAGPTRPYHMCLGHSMSLDMIMTLGKFCLPRQHGRITLNKSSMSVGRGSHSVWQI